MMSDIIAMWSGPRNVSTALMRSFENRSDCFVSDEPFYSHFLHKTGLKHLSNKTEVFFICLGDMPMVNHDIYNQLIKSKDSKEIIVPTYKG